VSTAGLTPPRWAEVLLERLLPDDARETVAGDLREEFVEGVLPQRGLVGARLWYVRQVLSFVPWFAKEGSGMSKILLVVSMFTLACGCWLAVMEMVLRHPGFGERIGVALAIALICAATILARMLHVGFRGERWLWAGAAVLIALGGQAFLHNARSAHFEGFVFVISLVLVLQGVLMLATLGRADSGSRRSLDAANSLQ
jgi:hypothetical protein